MVVLYERFENEPSDFFQNNDDEILKLPDSSISHSALNSASPHENFEDIMIADESETGTNLDVTIHDLKTKNDESAFSPEYINFMIKNDYPSELSVGSVIFGSLVSISLIVLQSVSIYVKAPYYVVGSGIWTGFLMLSIQALVIFLVYRPNYKTVNLIYNMNIFSVIVNFFFNVLLNLFALRVNCLGEKLIYGRACKEKDYGGFNAAMFVLGLANACLGILFVRKLKLSLLRIKNSILNKTNTSSPMMDKSHTNSGVYSADPDQ